MSWQDAAACKDIPKTVFFVERGVNATAAKEVCSGCPVKAECLAYAVEHSIEHGVWGGCAGWERRSMASPRTYRRQLIAGCGTDGGYTRHRRMGEATCGPCRDAHARAQRERGQAPRDRRTA